MLILGPEMPQLPHFGYSKNFIRCNFKKLNLIKRFREVFIIEISGTKNASFIPF